MTKSLLEFQKHLLFSLLGTSVAVVSPQSVPSPFAVSLDLA
jgi:hypothetical protein